MILERLQRLESQADLALNDGSIKQDVEKTEKIIGRVTALTLQVRQVLTAYEELCAVRPNDCSHVLRDLLAVRGELAKMAVQSRTKSLYGATTEFADALSDQEKTIRAVEKTLQSAWREFIESQHKSFVDREFLEILGRSGLPVDPLLDQFDSASRAWFLLETKSLPHRGDVARLQEATSSFNTVAEGLTEIVPPALAVFFRQADSNEGAPLIALSQEVLTFLEERELLDCYTIRARP
jgi:hypothetical protein